MLYFCWTIIKIAERWGLCPQTPLPPVAEGFSQPWAAGDFPKTPIGLRLREAEPPDPHDEFLATRLATFLLIVEIVCQ